jgi:hypothetical protein
MAGMELKHGANKKLKTRGFVCGPRMFYTMGLGKKIISLLSDALNQDVDIGVGERRFAPFI